MFPIIQIQENGFGEKKKFIWGTAQLLSLASNMYILAINYYLYIVLSFINIENPKDTQSCSLYCLHLYVIKKNWAQMTSSESYG